MTRTVYDRLLQRAPDLSAAVAAATVGAALAFQYIGGLAPCVLCLYQRWPHAAIIGLGLLGAWALRAGRPWLGAISLALIGAAGLLSAGLGFYHVGVEQGVFEGPGACTAAPVLFTDPAAFSAALANTPVVRCDQVTWSLFGLSMAAYNGLISLALAAFAWTSARALGLRLDAAQMGDAR